MNEHIFSIKDTLLQKEDKETMLGHKGVVLWMCGLSGSGKSTLARALENTLYKKGIQTKLLDGDNLRSGINSNLSFTNEDRTENIRRAAEIAKLFVENGEVVICSLISPTKQVRLQAKTIIGAEDYLEVFINASFEVCAQRDVKGLYKKAMAGEIKNFTGLDAPFEAPAAPFLELNTSENSIEECRIELVNQVLKKITL